MIGQFNSRFALASTVAQVKQKEVTVLDYKGFERRKWFWLGLQ
jgi:hypothetical protein